MASGLADPIAPTPANGGLLGPDRSWHLTFGLLLVGTFVAFEWWAFDYIGTASKVLLTVATVIGMFMAFNMHLGLSTMNNFFIMAMVGAGAVDGGVHLRQDAAG